MLISDHIVGDWAVAERQQRAHEDRHQAKQLGPFRYFAVFDGHGGAKKMNSNHIGDWCTNELHNYLGTRLDQTNLDNEDEVIATIKKGFVDFDTEAYESDHEYENRVFGTTCTMILIDDTRKKIYQVNLGDSRSIIFDDGIISETRDHNPSDPIEKVRIESAGANVIGNTINGTLGVARAFGDFIDYKVNRSYKYDPIHHYVSVMPDVTVVPCMSNSYAILTSDAPFECTTIDNHALMTMFRDNMAINDNSLSKTAEAMVTEIVPKTNDDVTIILVRI